MDVKPRALMVCTRDFSVGDNGRNKVLSTYIQCLSEFYIIDIVMFDRISDENAFRRKFPFVNEICAFKNGLMSTLLALLYSLTNGKSVNSSFFLFNTKANHVLTTKFATTDYALVYVDTIRLSKIVMSAKSDNVNVLLDMDDLYSKRYEQARGKSYDVLGYWAERFPRFLVRMLNFFGRLFMARESRLLKVEEVHAAKSANQVTLVSEVEAEYLSKEANVFVRDFPMSIKLSKYSWSSAVTRDILSMVFVGSPKLPQNKITLDEINRYCKLNPGALFEITVVGDVSNFDTASYDKRIFFAGFVDDLYKYISGFDCFFAPIFFGTGVKTKVLEAAAVGMPVVTTPKGVEGTELSKFCLIFDDLQELTPVKLSDFISMHNIEKVKLQQDYIQQKFSQDSCMKRLRLML